jgi:spore photoproduct lyase
VLSLRRKFSHLYIERAALDYPDTQALLGRFPRAQRIVIDRYGEIINRSHQEWRLQKQTQKMVLAVRRESLIYPMPDIVQAVGDTPAFYNTPIINCLYDCSYCYLQGMYSSANIVVFVNTADFLAAARAEADRHGAIYLSLSYDTDLLGFEGILPLTARWIDFARHESRVTVEVRTKSAGFGRLAHLEPVPNAILAWTVSPTETVRSHEQLTASLEARLDAARAAIERGWRVRLVFDPVLWSSDWRERYEGLMKTVAAAVPLDQIEDATVGVFRMNGDFFKRFKKVRPEAAATLGPLGGTQSNVVSYPAALEAEMRTFMVERLSPHVRRVHTS